MVSIGKEADLDEEQSAEARPPGSRSSFPIIVLTGSILALALGFGWTIWQTRQSVGGRNTSQARRTTSWPPSPWKNARPGVAYVGDVACARCHADIAATFHRHPMGRSLAPISVTPVGGDGSDRLTTFEADSSEFTIERSNGREFHRETQYDEAGRVLAQIQEEVKYALGIGPLRNHLPGGARWPIVPIAHFLV